MSRSSVLSGLIKILVPSLEMTSYYILTLATTHPRFDNGRVLRYILTVLHVALPFIPHYPGNVYAIFGSLQEN